MLLIRIVCVFQYLLSVNIFVNAQEESTAPLVTTENGRVRGHVGLTYGRKKKFFAYRGIPYAQPPVGHLRFKAPIKAKNWTEILDATQDKSECVQNTSPVTGSEDCLYVNVYTPNVNSSNLTVMVWIHGGAFVGGNASYSSFAPDNLLEEDVIYVSLNYRLGAFGFLSTGDTTCSGNWGLKDQVLGLQWVQSNIKYFGGDPNKVTIFGESAGSASVSYLIQSDKTAGLYRSAIMESGVSLCLWSLTRQARTIAFKIGKNLQINTSNSSVLLEGLRKVNYTRLQEISSTTAVKFLLIDALAGLVYSPVIEPVHDGALFYNKSDELLREGKFNRVPIIIGINSNEGAAFGSSLNVIFRTYIFSRYDLNASLLAPIDLNANTISTIIAGNVIKFRYFGILPASLQSDSLVQFISDDQFNRPVIEAVVQQSKYIPVYFYMFSFKGALNANNGTFKGVGHAEELPYVFRINSTGKIPAADVITVRRVVKFWTNFAKYSNPTPQREELFQNQIWPATNSTNLVYMNIATNLTLEKDPFKQSMEFYDDIYNKHGIPPYDTY